MDEQGRLYAWGKGEGGKLGLGDTDNRKIPTLVPLYYPPVTNLTQQTTYYKIQKAIDDANDNDVIEAQEFTYEENVDFGSKTLTLQSTNPYNWSTVAATVIDGTVNHVVNFSYNTGSRLTGFTITNGYYGVNCGDSQVQIDHCIVEENDGPGIFGNSSSITVTNSIIRNNGQHGIGMHNSIPTVQPKIINNWIYNNGTSSGNFHGISLSSMDSQVIIRNNTIVNNDYYGIIAYNEPNITNCIVWGNGSSAGDNFDGISNVNYCCFEETESIGGTGNITSDPLLIDIDANNLHLDPLSPCIDAADPNFTADANETDIDNKPRVVDGNDDGIERVDMGADEFYWSKSDFDDSNYVNFVDYAMFVTAWLTKSGDPDYKDLYDLEDDDVIDYKDLSLFCEDWLWEAPWSESYQMMMATGDGDGFKSISIEAVSVDSIKLEVPQPVWLSTQPASVPQATVGEILDWLDELWESEEVKDSMTYEEYMEFREAIKLSAEYEY